MRRSTTFSIPTERGEQIRALAKFNRTSVSGLVSDWIDHEIKIKGLSDKIPGVSTATEGHTATLEMEGLTITFPTKNEAGSFVDAMERVTTRSGVFGMLVGDDMLSIKRAGSGVVVERNSERRSFAPNVALMVANQLRAVATNCA